MDYNPFNKSVSPLESAQPVLERTEAECEGMICKSCGDKFGMPTEGSCKYESKDPNGKNWMENKTEAVSESFLIPEDIPQQERTAFHGAAAAAHKAGKTSFNFGGKKHPVTMKKDAANAIADQNEGIVDKAKQGIAKLKSMTPAARQAARRAQAQRNFDNMGKTVFGPAFKSKNDKMKKNKAEAKGGDKEGDVDMNPKLKKEGVKESRIRSALKSVLSEKKDDHTKNATKPEGMLDKSKASKGAMDMMNQPIEKDDTEAKGHDDASKAGRVTKAAAQRNGADAVRSGDQKIKPSATPVKESSMSGPDRNHSIVSAYASMNEARETYAFDFNSREHAKTAAKDFKAGGHTARIRPQHTGGDHALHVTTKKDNHVAIHAIAKKHKSNMRSKEMPELSDSPEQMRDTTYGHRLDTDR